MLQSYRWPGNVRELQNVIERAVTFATDGLITKVDLPREVVVNESTDAPSSLAERERIQVLDVMQQHRWNRRTAAEALGISRTTLWRKLKDYEIG